MLMQASAQKLDRTGRGAASAHALIRLALTSGDERLGLLPDTGRNKYGVPPDPRRDEIWFASSTASPISQRGYEAAATAIDQFLDAPSRRIGDWPREIRGRLQNAFGIARSSVILAGSGTEAELIVAALASHVLARPMTNVVLAPGETGSGVMLAAAGRHFLNSASCAPSVDRGALLSGILPHSIIAAGVEIRDPGGRPLDAETVDDAVRSHVMHALQAGRDVLVHCLATSKTGLSALRRSTAAALRSASPDRCLIVVDACQLRCSATQIRQDLAAGFIVVVSGSKFVGGPPFSAAVLIPPDLQSRIADLALPPGLAAYSAYHDWPANLREGSASRHAMSFNLPLYVRWEAALIELERYQSIASARREAVIARFTDIAEGLIERTAGIRLLMPPAADEHTRAKNDIPARRDGARWDVGGYAVDLPVSVVAGLSPRTARCRRIGRRRCGFA